MTEYIFAVTATVSIIAEDEDDAWDILLNETSFGELDYVDAEIEEICNEPPDPKTKTILSSIVNGYLSYGDVHEIFTNKKLI